DRITAPDVVAVHVNDAPPGIARDEQIDNQRALPMETGVIDLVGFMGKLEAMGYDGPVTAEPFSKRVVDLAATDPKAAVAAAARRAAPGRRSRGGERRGRPQISARTASERTVRAIFSRFGSPRASDRANLAAWSTVILDGSGGSNGSTTASTTTGPGVASARS